MLLISTVHHFHTTKPLMNMDYCACVNLLFIDKLILLLHSAVMRTTYEVCCFLFSVIRCVLLSHYPTVRFFLECTVFFALRSGAEHRCLRLNPPQITVHQSKEGTYLLYVEDASKNHQGGLKGRKVSSKQVKHFENVENPYRCFV